MRRLLILTLMLLVSACATERPISSDSLANFRERPGVVAFLDTAGQIRYWYANMMLNVDQKQTEYASVWDSNRELSAVHAAELSRMGFQVRSLFDVLSDSELARLAPVEKALTDLSAPDREQYKHVRTQYFQEYTHPSDLAPSVLQAITPEVSNLLLRKGYQNFILVSWDGFHVYDSTISPSAEEFFHTRFWFIDLPRHQIMWAGGVLSYKPVPLSLAKHKPYLERDGFASLKAHALRLTRNTYRAPSSQFTSEISESVAGKLGLNSR